MTDLVLYHDPVAAVEFVDEDDIMDKTRQVIGEMVRLLRDSADGNPPENGELSRHLCRLAKISGERSALGRALRDQATKLTPATDRKHICTTPANSAANPLPRRYDRVLRRLLHGESEKQIAKHLGLSHHTVHEYAKRIYRHFGINSRAELMLACRHRDQGGPFLGTS